MSGNVYIGPSLTRSLAAMFVFLAVPEGSPPELPETLGLSDDDE